MIKIWLPLLLLLHVLSPEHKESCERLNGNSITLFPVCGDSSLYIYRTFERDKWITEDAYRKGVPIYSRKVWLSGKSLPDSATYTEFIYDPYDGKLIRTASYSGLEYASAEKSFRVNDSLNFVIRYYDNAFIFSYGLMNDFCWIYGAESGSKNTYIWKGPYQAPVRDTLKNFVPESPGQTMSIGVTCGEPTGIWRKYDFNGNIVDSVDMTGTSGESASSMYERIRNGSKSRVRWGYHHHH